MYASCEDRAFTQEYHQRKAPSFRWVDTWEKELLPIERLCFHLGLADKTLFLLEPDGSADDARLCVEGAWMPLQITLAYEDFGLSGDCGDGYHHRLETEFLLEHGMARGGDRYRRTKGKVERISRGGAVWVGEIERRWSEAISRALCRKAIAANTNCNLLIFCTDFSLHGASHFVRVASEQTCQHTTAFKSVAVVSHHAGYRHWHNAPLSWPTQP